MNFHIGWVLCLVTLMAGAALAEEVVTLTLENDGGEPKTTLRYVPAVGTAQTMTSRSNYSNQIVMDGKEQPMPPMPAITLINTMTVTGVSPTGDVTYDFKLTGAQAKSDNILTPQTMVDMMNQAWAPFIGKGGTITVDNRGFQTGRNAYPQGLDAEQRKLLEQTLISATLPLPEEPVGFGAKWTVKRVSTQAGVRNEHNTTVTMTNWSAFTITLEVEFGGRSNRPGGKSGTGAPGAKLNFVISGKGSGTVDLQKIAPQEMHMKMVMNGDMSTQAGGKTFKMTMRNITETHLASQRLGE
jgi:hypothetical protein